MSIDVLSHFGGLDELIQVIYDGVERFVLLSKVDYTSWTVYLGLQGPEGRWWKGQWHEKDILQLTGSQASEMILEGFADKLEESIVKGNTSVGDWSSEKGAEINLTLGSGGKTPVRIPLVEMSPEEAASHATKVFWDIAVEAQSRKCRLNGVAAPSYVISPPPALRPDTSSVNKTSGGSSSRAEKRPSPPPARPSTSDQRTQNEVKILKAQLAQEKKRSAPEDSGSKPGTSAPPKAKTKGASLANPNKKARKYQAVEFESDEE